MSKWFDSSTSLLDKETPSVMADIDGDNDLDWILFDRTATKCHINNGTSFNTSIDTPYYSYNKNWRVKINPGTLADIDGDGKDDLIGFGHGGVVVGLSAELSNNNKFIRSSDICKST